MKRVNVLRRKRSFSGLYAVVGYWIGNYFKATLADPLSLFLSAISYGLFRFFVSFFIDLAVYKGWLSRE